MHYVRTCEQCYLTKFIDPATNEEREDEEEDEPLPNDEEEPSTSASNPKRQRLQSIIDV